MKFLKQQYFDKYPEWIHCRDLDQDIQIDSTDYIRYNRDTGRISSELAAELLGRVRDRDEEKPYKIIIPKFGSHIINTAVILETEEIYRLEKDTLHHFFYHLPMTKGLLKIYRSEQKHLKGSNLAYRFRQDHKDFKEFVHGAALNFYGEDKIISLKWEKQRNTDKPYLNLNINYGNFYIRNGRGKHFIRGLDIQYLFRYKRRGLSRKGFYFVSLKGRRSIMTELEYRIKYRHSHLPRGRTAEYLSFCVGDSTVSSEMSFAIESEDQLEDLFMGVENFIAYEDRSNPFHYFNEVTPTLEHTISVPEPDSHERSNIIGRTNNKVKLSSVNSEIRGLELQFQPEISNVKSIPNASKYDVFINENKLVNLDSYITYYNRTTGLEEQPDRVIFTVKEGDTILKVVSSQHEKLSVEAEVIPKQQVIQSINKNQTEKLYNYLYEQQKQQVQELEEVG